MTTLRAKRAGETIMAAINFTPRLASDEELSSGLTVAEVATADLTLSSAAITDEDLALDDRTVKKAKMVTFLVAGGVATKEYTVRATVTTDAGQVLIGTITFRVN